MFKGNKNFLSFKDARHFVHNLGLKNQVEWYQYTKSNKKPANIPSTPYSVYKNKGWKGMGDWLGTRIGFNGFLSFNNAKEFSRTLKLKNQHE